MGMASPAPFSQGTSRTAISRRVRCAGLLIAAMVGLSACSGSGVSYVKNSDLGTFFKVPSSWTVFDEDEIFEARPPALPPQAIQSVRESQWLVAFDASPQPSAESAFVLGGNYPRGFAQVRLLEGQERDQFSFASLRNLVVQLDQLAQQGRVVPPAQIEEVTGAGGLHGIRGVFTVRTDGGFVTFRQVAMVDSARERLWILVVGCDADCYERNQGAINSVVRSWTIKER